MNPSEYRNWRLDFDVDRVCWLTIDRAGESSNSLSREVLTELEQIVSRFEKEPPRGPMLHPLKPLQLLWLGCRVNREFRARRCFQL